MLTRSLVVGVAAAVAVVGWVADPANADGGFVAVDCQQRPRAGCDVQAGSSRSSGSITDTRPIVDAARGRRACRDSTGQVAPCTDPDFGVMGADGCYARPYSGGFRSMPGVGIGGDPGQRPGSWFLVTCLGPVGPVSAVEWRAAGTPTDAAAPPPPIVLARRALNRLDLPSPSIGASPRLDRTQLAWRARHATAAAPGVSVTATAIPTTVTWRTGDGATVVCRGPGTQFPPGGDPARPSPTCGHTYHRSSAAQPAAAYRLSATVTWTVTWAGGGQAGSFPPLTTTTTAAVRVAESQALVTARGS
jgi:hypothetical protein